MARAAAALRLPERLPGAGASAQAGGAQAMELAFAHSQLLTDLRRVELPAAMKLQQMAHKVRRVAMTELTMFF